jgi:methionine-rich copper-binding protein CopC
MNQLIENITRRTIMKKIWILINCVISLAFCTQALAHAMLKNSTPQNLAILSSSPKTIDLKFGHETKLTSIKLSNSKENIPIAFDRNASASTSFSVPVPLLTPNVYKVKWGTLSSDGHAMTGSFTFTIKGN